MEPAVEFCPSCWPPGRDLVHFRAHVTAQLNECSRQTIELILQPGAASRQGRHAFAEPAQKGGDPAGLRIQVFVEIDGWGGRLDLLELPRRRGRKAAGNVLEETALEEGAQ